MNQSWKKNEEKDLGVTVTNKTFDIHINRITGKTYNLLRNIKTAYTHLDEEIDRCLSLVFFHVLSDDYLCLTGLKLSFLCPVSLSIFIISLIYLTHAASMTSQLSLFHFSILR